MHIRNIIASETFDNSLNVLSITDEEISGDWKLGMVRSIGTLLSTSGKPEHTANLHHGKVDTKSDYYHIAGVNWGTDKFPACAIVSVSHVEEADGSYTDHDTFGSYNNGAYLLKAEAKCECGHFSGKISRSISLGELIYEIASVKI